MSAPARIAAIAPPSTQATDILDLMMRLADLLAHETDRVRSGHVRDIEPLQREKLRVTRLYQRAVKDLEQSATKITALPVPLRAQIVAASARLADSVAENERALRIGCVAARRLLDLVVESVKDRLKPVSRYNARLASVSHAHMAAVAVDRRL